MKAFTKPVIRVIRLDADIICTSDQEETVRFTFSTRCEDMWDEPHVME